MSFDIALFVISLSYGLLIVIVVFFDRKFNRDKFSAVKLVAYFSLLEWFSMIWFSVRTDSLYYTVLKDVRLDVEPEMVSAAYLMSLSGFIFTVIGAGLSSYRFRRFPVLIDYFFIRSGALGRRQPAITGWVLLLLGFFFYLVFLSKIGGVSFLWQNLAQRTNLSAGLGYYQVLYNTLSIIGGALIALSYFRKKQWLKLFLLYFFVAIVLVTSGSRWYLGLYTYILFLVYHFNVRPIKHLFNHWTLSIALFLLVFMLLFVQMRKDTDQFDFLESGDHSVSVFDKVESDIIKRFGVIERQVAVIGYFEANDHWLGASYLGLLRAYQPRDKYPDKPPIDTGVYLRAIADGIQFTPPVAVQDLQATSWPEQNLAGYMNFGFFGYFVFSLTSGFILVVFYQLIQLRPLTSGPVILFGFLGFMGAPNVSPYGVFELMKILLMFSIIGWFSSIKIWRPNRNFRV